MLNKLRTQYGRLGAAEGPATLQTLVTDLQTATSQTDELLAGRRALMERCSLYHNGRADVDANLDQLRRQFDQLQQTKDLHLPDRKKQLKVGGSTLYIFV